MKPLYKYFPVFAALLIVAILGTGFYGATIVRSLFYERIVVDLADTARMLQNLLLNESPENIDSFCKTAGTGHSRITVVNDDGVVLGDSIANPSDMDNHGQRPEISRAFLGVLGNSTRYSDTLGRDMVYLALPVFNLSGKSLVLRTATPLRTISSDLRNAYMKIAVAGAISLILVSILGFALTSRVNGALQIIQNAVREYSKGNLSFRPRVFRPPELKRVADTISDLAGDLLSRAADASRQRDKLETIFAGMEEAVIVLDTNLAIQEMNESAYRLSDLEPGEGIGKGLLLAFRNSHLHEVADQALKKGGGVEDEFVVFTDRERHLQIHGTVIPGPEDSEGARIVLVLNDVTRLKNLEQVRKDFVANVSHELKTPITAVRGYIETLLGDDFKDPNEAKNFLNIVLQHVDRFSAIIEDLLIISRLEQDSGAGPETAICNLSDLIGRVVEIHRPRAAEKSISLKISCSEGESITANQGLLEQGIANLLDNAIKYSGARSTIHVTVIREGDSIIMRVADQGRGIPEEHLDRIFERFYRVDSGRSRALGGTGLGLSIVKHVAVSHGGRVTAESTEGEGSVFSIILPG
ncbi:MAG: PAS domain-containing protein [Spirochaetales bacterium]|jgi:two-component system, OmpR family, phosphate regulon sensor histidine kinase PhoR|nr:PAS domain-containing protein [Spirochaetales bacterium]